MYVEMYSHAKFEQEVLYFKLNNAFNMDIQNELNIKLNGVYAIYFNDTCLFVGYSKNLASSIATHLKNKYKIATSIHLWNVEEIGFDDFSTRNKISQQNILINCEKQFLKKLKPVDIPNIDMNHKPQNFKKAYFKEPSIVIKINTNALIISDKKINKKEVQNEK